MPALPLTALRAFEVSARRLSFTEAAEELCVSQSAVSHQVRALEARLGVSLFKRLPRGLALTEEGAALAPALAESFERMAALLEQIGGGKPRQPLTVGVVSTFAIGWLMPRLERFRIDHPQIDLRLRTHNNKVDLATEGLDCAIQFGDGAPPFAQAVELLRPELTPLCSPGLAALLHHPSDLARLPLLRSYRSDEWPRWFAKVGIEPPKRGPMFDSSVVMVVAAERSLGVALAPPSMFAHELARRSLVRPFPAAIDAGAYFLVRLKSRPLTPAFESFAAWLQEQLRDPLPA